MLTVAALALCAPLVAAGPSAASTPGLPRFPGATATSVTTASGVWASVPMGLLAQPLNTFWQLFYRPKGENRWRDFAPSLATATNGGLVLAAPGDGSLVVSVRASNRLEISPVVQTRNGGRSWSPGAPLTGRVDALAADGAAGALALSDQAGRTSVSVAASASAPWRRLVSTATLAASRAGASCRPSALTSVGYGAGHTVLVGAACGRGGAVGLFADIAGHWRAVGPDLPPSLGADRSEVLTLGQAPGGYVALLGATGPFTSALMAAWSASGKGGWRESAPLSIGASEQLLSAGPAAGGGVFAVLSGASGRRGEVVDAATRRWQALPTLPQGTATLAFGPGTRVDALAESGKTLRDYELDRSSPAWRLSRILDVALLYGSSG